MKITLLVVGKTTDPRLIALTDEYCARLKHYVPFEIKVITDDNDKGILKAVPTSSQMILLDERGKEYRSIEFADFIQKKMNSGRDVVFVVGGPYGFTQEVYDRADGMVSLSKMTFSHQMIRLLFVEQLYRACTIIKHEPYHHE